MSKGNSEKIWSNCLKIIKDNIGEQEFKTWFKPIQPVKLENHTLTIQVPSNFFYEWLEAHYIDLLRKTIKKELGEDGKLEYEIIIENNRSMGQKPNTISISGSTVSSLREIPGGLLYDNISPIRNPFVIPGIKKASIDSQLNPIYTLDNFIEGDCNKLARSAGFSIAKNPGKTSFNPLLVYGGVGLGKTHLAQAIGIEVKNNSPDKVVLYVAASKFKEQFIDAVLNNRSNDFVHFYEMIEVLIIDDIHDFAGQIKTQDILFHIFNRLHQNNKQLIFTADKAPSDLDGLEQRLLSRFNWGLITDLQPPDYETRLGILKKKAHLEGIKLNNEIFEYLASNIKTNVRDLETALISLIAQASFNKKEITLGLAKQVVEKIAKNVRRGEISIDYIQKIICDYFDISMEQLKSKCRKRELVQARQIAMYFARQYTKSTTTNIGTQTGNRNHATVLYACHNVRNLMEGDKRFRTTVEEIERKLNL